LKAFIGKLAKLVIGALKYPRLVGEVAVVFLALLVWFEGHWIGLESETHRVQVILLIVLVRALVHIGGHILAQKRASRLEASLRQQARQQAGKTTGERAEEVDAIREQFEKGIAALKESNLSKGLRGKAALYALPWYMFIGPPGSGKSTALRHSGLQFPYMAGTGQGLQGLGGTRNCDWWFTNEGIVLDTAGRYVSADEDQAEWLAFLDLLKKHRPGTPLNGVIVAISIADLLQAGDGEVEEHAKKIRIRIDELIKRLGVVFPVYVLFTKCDLVQGFVESFEDLNRAEREQIWGATFTKASAGDPPEVRFQKEFEELLAILKGRRLGRLATTRGTHKVTIFGFPLQMNSARDRLSRFIEVLFQANPYQESPLFRGFYFTSGTQEGTPIDRILSSVGRAAGLMDVSASPVRVADPKSYFLRDLFTEVIFPDRPLVAPSSAIHRQRGYLRVGAFVLSITGVLLAVIALSVSFVGYRQVLGSALAAALNPPEPGFDVPRFESNLEYLQGLGVHFSRLRSYEQEGVPLRLWGFYQGGQLHEAIREMYLHRFARQFLGPTKEEMEEILAGFVGGEPGADGAGQGSDYYYSLLKAYVMLGDAIHLQPDYLERWMSEFWRDKLPLLYQERPAPDDVKQAVAHQIHLYSAYLAKEEASRLALNGELVRDVQQRLRQIPRVQRIYALARREAQDQIQPFTVDSVLQGGHQGSVVSDFTIPGIYTMEGWKGPFQQSVAKVLEDLGEEGWVIGEPEVGKSQLDKEIKRLYFQDYARYWRDLVNSLNLRPAATPAQVEEVLAVLAQPDSPLLRVFRTIDQNTRLDTEGIAKLQLTANSLLEKVKQSFGLQSEATPSAVAQREAEEVIRRLADPSDFSGSVSIRFKPIHELVLLPKDAKEDSLLGRYLAEVRKLHQTLRPILRAESPSGDTKMLAKNVVSGEPNDLLQAIKATDLLLHPFPPEIRESLSALLMQPWTMAMQGVMDRAKAEVSRRWEGEVYPACQRNIEGHYPFLASGPDAPASDVVEFLHPDTGTLWRFYQADLRPFIEQEQERWQVKKWRGIGIGLSDEFVGALQHAKAVTDSLFPKGGSDLGTQFEVYPNPPKGEVSRSVSEVRLDVGGQALRYRMEPQEWHEMKWPGPAASAGAVIQVQVGTNWITKEHKDLWGFFRLLGQAEEVKEESEGAQYQFQWELMAAGQPVKVQYNVRARGHKNPFAPGFFTRFRCLQNL
jgi:type VI secretion system protein ImpL